MYSDDSDVATGTEIEINKLKASETDRQNDAIVVQRAFVDMKRVNFLCSTVFYYNFVSSYRIAITKILLDYGSRTLHSQIRSPNHIFRS